MRSVNKLQCCRLESASGIRISEYLPARVKRSWLAVLSQGPVYEPLNRSADRLHTDLKQLRLSSCALPWQYLVLRRRRL